MTETDFEHDLEYRLAQRDDFEHVCIGGVYVWTVCSCGHRIMARERAVMRGHWLRWLSALAFIASYAVPKIHHHKIDDSMELALQRCACGEWFSDYEFDSHIRKMNGSVDYYPFGYENRHVTDGGEVR